MPGKISEEKPDAPLPLRPAATLILLRDRVNSSPELLMLERSATMRFAGGALVFPGGAVDPGDRVLAQKDCAAIGVDDATARVTAIRETLEESGIAIGMVPTPDLVLRTLLRAGIEAGEDFGTLLAAHGLTLDLSSLMPFARWRPQRNDDIPPFDARFYLARAPKDQRATVDATENVSLIWSSASDMLISNQRIIFPTQRNLERLAQYADYNDASEQTTRSLLDIVTPWIEARAGEPHLCIPDHLGYPVTSQPMRTVIRM